MGALHPKSCKVEGQEGNMKEGACKLGEGVGVLCRNRVSATWVVLLLKALVRYGPSRRLLTCL